MYVKLYSSIVNSSIWSEDSDTCKVWITMMALADRDGFVFGSASGLARIAAVDPEKVNAIIQKFLEPDPQSADIVRSPENQGRRIQVVPGGWQLLNYLHYRDLKDADARRGQIREAVRKHRNQLKSSVNSVSPSEAEAEAEAKKSNTCSSPSADERFNEFWKVYPRRQGKARAVQAWKKLTPDERSLAITVSSKRTNFNDDPQFIPMPATWLNGRRWEDERLAAPSQPVGSKLVLNNPERERELEEWAAKDALMRELNAKRQP